MVPGESLLSSCSPLGQKHLGPFTSCRLAKLSPPPQTEDPLKDRPIQYQVVALYDYAAQGPEDLEFSEGDTIDILGEGETS